MQRRISGLRWRSCVALTSSSVSQRAADDAIIQRTTGLVSATGSPPKAKRR